MNVLLQQGHFSREIQERKTRIQLSTTIRNERLRQWWTAKEPLAVQWGQASQ